ncbi:protein of unknown function [Flavobacteriaceae bacterium MAR_2010_188]|nr:protein of unknown function [Flavobacteriaceae bacterium MAR_2010_188]
MKNLLIAFLISSFMLSCGSSKLENKNDTRAIENVLDTQVREWNDSDINGFMQGYWKSDELKFYGSNGLTRGWNKVLENYKVRYPNKDFTGTLKFDIENISRISEDSYYVMGKFNLDRKAGDANGVFMLIFKKIDGQWKIIADMCA